MEAFFSAKQLSANRRRAHRQALSAVIETLGGEILALNVENLDLPRKRAVIIGKGAAIKNTCSGPPGLLGFSPDT